MTRLNLPVVVDAEGYAAHFHDGVWPQAAAAICGRHNVSYQSLRRSLHGENIIFFVDQKLIIKIFSPFRESYLREKAALDFADSKTSIKTPKILHTGELEGWFYIVMTQLTGRPANEVWPELAARERIEIVSHLGVALKRLHGYSAPLSQPGLNRDWHSFIDRQTQTCVERQQACRANPEWLESLPNYVGSRRKLLPDDFQPVLLHGDVHLGNLLFERENSHWEIKGLFDFGDSFCGFCEYEFVAPGVLMIQGNRELQRNFLLAYGYEESQLDLDLRARLMLLTILYECSDLRKYAVRLKPEAINFKLEELESAIWTFAAN